MSCFHKDMIIYSIVLSVVCRNSIQEYNAMARYVPEISLWQSMLYYCGSTMIMISQSVKCEEDGKRSMTTSKQIKECCKGVLL
jgi:hypothetical protein